MWKHSRRLTIDLPHASGPERSDFYKLTESFQQSYHSSRYVPVVSPFLQSCGDGHSIRRGEMKSMLRRVLPQPLWQLLRGTRRTCRTQALKLCAVARIGVQLGCPKINLGNEGASWCVCPTGLSENSIAYSFGVGREISFDIALIQQFGMRVHAFDPTPRSVAWIRT